MSMDTTDAGRWIARLNKSARVVATFGEACPQCSHPVKMSPRARLECGGDCECSPHNRRGHKEEGHRANLAALGLEEALVHFPTIIECSVGKGTRRIPW